MGQLGGTVTVTADGEGASTIDFEDDTYTVEQSLIRNKYAAYDSAGEGEEVFTVKPGGIIDVAGNYAITDAAPKDAVLATAMVIDAIRGN